MDHDYIINSAIVAKECGCKHFHFVSSGNADINASMLYAHVKVKYKTTINIVYFNYLKMLHYYDYYIDYILGPSGGRA